MLLVYVFTILCILSLFWSILVLLIKVKPVEQLQAGPLGKIPEESIAIVGEDSCVCISPEDLPVDTI